MIFHSPHHPSLTLLSRPQKIYHNVLYILIASLLTTMSEPQLSNVEVAQQAAEILHEEEVELNLEHASNIQLTKVEEKVEDDEFDVFIKYVFF